MSAFEHVKNEYVDSICKKNRFRENSLVPNYKSFALASENKIRLKVRMILIYSF